MTNKINNKSAISDLKETFGSRIKRFQKLMRYKIKDILLVSSLYDNYLFEEDGRLYELIRQEYQSLNLSHAPEITHVTTGKEALEMVQEDTFDLVITTMHIEDMHVIKYAKMMHENGLKIPMVLLAYDNTERKEIETNHDTSVFDRIFIWQGDYRLLLGVIKYVEDKYNVENDTKQVGVQSIILIEDNVKFYSSYLSLIYTEIFKQSQRLISEGINATHRFLRMRARPKILLCTNYEEAWGYYERYKDCVLGVIADVNFRRNGVKDSDAGLKFAMEVKKEHDDIPILIQSSNIKYKEKAHEIGASFLLKNSPRLLHDLRDIMIRNFSFGDFVFRTPRGEVVGRADNLFSLVDQIEKVPDESLVYHSERNHFSNWLKARTEFWLANELRPRKVTDFETVSGLRKNLVTTIREYLKMRQRGTITDFNKEFFDPQNSFARIGGGSLGGKARGLGFINTLISQYSIRDKFKDVEVSVPSAVVLATDVFDYFLEKNNLFNYALNETDDDKLMKRFLQATKFPRDVLRKLKEFLEIIHEPLAVRSSSLLEDSQFQPFAGVYQTYMIPNNNENIKIRLNELLQSIKAVYASTFSKHSKDYLKATSYRLEEEKMAIIIQKLVGAKHQNRFYPDFAGVAKSYNFYPIPPQKASDGIALVALGLGKTVVEGGENVRFSPKYPKHLLQFFSTKETIRNAQQDFYALDLDRSLEDKDTYSPEQFEQKYKLDKAEKDGTLYYAGSTYSPENDAVYDGISRSGKRVVTFAPILKHKMFPLPEILKLMLELGVWGMGTHVELEFAVNTHVPEGQPKDFAMLQMRPMVLSREAEDIDITTINKDDLVVHSSQVLGNGVIDNIYDALVVDIEKFERTKSREIAREVAELNRKLLDAHRPYLLIGVGRWGSFDPWLGIPVTWDQISGANVIVESGFKDFKVTPSQGSHFFQNITSFRIGFFTVNSFDQEGFIDWEWLRKEPAVEEFENTRHLRFDEQIISKISGHQNVGVIYKPGRTVKKQIRK